jgi:Rap1a immunity proteins
MKWRLIAATLAAAVLIGPAHAQEDLLSGNYMLPLCKTWLRIASHDLDVIKDEIRTGNAKPGGIVQYFTEAGMCAGQVVGISVMLNHEPMACIPKEITNAQLVRVVVASIEKLPATMHENFSALASAAIVDAWPCSK